MKLRWILSLSVAATSLAGCSAGVADEGNVVRIRIEHSRFIPGKIDVDPGSTVTFIVTNDDPIDHELIIGDQAIQDVHETGTEEKHGARPGEISIPARSERTTTYRFEAPGELIYGCHLPGHYEYGMRGAIDIR